jgi:hypothetical protein
MFEKSLEINQPQIKPVALIEEKQYSVDEYFKSKQIVVLNPDHAKKEIGKIATKLSKDHNLSIRFIKENGYVGVGCYDEKVLQTAVTIYRNQKSLDNDLFSSIGS